MLNKLLYIFIVSISMLFIFSKVTYAMWQEMEVIESEEVEKLSLFDRLDGKKPEVKRTYKKVYRWYEDIENDTYAKDAFILIPVDVEKEPNKIGYANKYYFDSDGYLITDNITFDYHVVDFKGREIDNDLNPIYYYIGEEVDSKENVYMPKKDEKFVGTPSAVILSPGVVIRNKYEKIFNNQMSKDMTEYITSGNGYQNDCKGKIYTKAKWIHALKLSGNGAAVCFENRVNNFNKVSGKIAIEEILTSNRNTWCMLTIYDKEKYDIGELDEYIYSCDDFNYSNYKEFTFTFDRRIKNLIFVLNVDGKYTSRNCYLKDLRFGFSKTAYKELLDKIADEKKEMEDEAAWEAYIDSLVAMGVYTRDVEYLEIIDEDGEILDEVEDETYEEDDEYYNAEKYEDELLNRHSGPAFDEELKNREDVNIGPYFDIVGTRSNTNKRKNDIKIKYAN